MPKTGLLLLLCFLRLNISAQESKLSLYAEFGGGITNMLGKGSYHNSYMVGEVPIENDYTKNPYGRKIKANFSVGVALQYNAKEFSGLIGSIEYHQPGGKVNLNGVTYPLSASIVRPASGKTIIDMDAIAVSASAFKKFGQHRAIPYLYTGLSYSFVFDVQENGKAIDYTVTGEFISDKKHAKQNFLQWQTGFWYDISHFRVGMQYRTAIAPIKNNVLNDGSKIFPQSIVIKLAYRILQ